MSTILLGVAFFCVLAADGYKALPGLWAVNPQSFSQGEAAAWGVTGSKVNMPTFRSRYHGYLFCFKQNKTHGPCMLFVERSYYNHLPRPANNGGVGSLEWH